MEDPNNSNDLRISITKYKKCDDSNFTITFNNLKVSNLELSELLAKFCNNSTNVSVSEIVSAISIKKNRQNVPSTTYVSKNTLFDKGINQHKDELITKTTLYKPVVETINSDLLNSYTINVYEFNKNDEMNKNIDYIDIKLSNIFNLHTLQEWLVKVDVIKHLKNPNEYTVNLRTYKDELLKKYQDYPNDINMNCVDYVQISLEYVGDKNDLNKGVVSNAVSTICKLIDDNFKNQREYQDFIYNISKLIYTDKYIVNKFKYKSGFKHLLPNVIELNRNIYFNIVLPNINSFYITDKIDGQRCLVIIIESKNKLRKNIYILSDNLYTVGESDADLLLDQLENNIYIYDAEMIYSSSLSNTTVLDQHKLKLYVFDIIVHKSENIAHKPFEERFKCFNSVSKVIDKYKLGMMKTFIKLEINNYKDELSKFYHSRSNLKEYEIDGLIFTPSSSLSDIRIMNSKKRGFKTVNTEYYNMIGYKWKPIEKLSIDFYVAKLPNSVRNTSFYKKLDTDVTKNMYILCSGIDINTFNRLKMQLMPNYVDIIPKAYHTLDYFPIQFSPDDNPYVYIYHSNRDDIHNKACEFLYKNDKWELMKIRTDRDIEIKRGEYYGNAFRYAELIWQSIKHPLSFEQLLQDSNKSYFMSTSDDIYVSQRGFNSFVKTEILKSITTKNKPSNTQWIMDLACGKGQDLARFVTLGFKNIIEIDKDEDAIYQLTERKYKLELNEKRIDASKKMYNRNDKSIKYSFRVFARILDLADSYKNNIEQLNVLNIKKDSVDVSICNFALHYFTESEKSLMNFIFFMNYYTKSNGRFIFTCFDGKKIANLLKDTDTYNWEENGRVKYSIQKRYKSDFITDIGQKIGVILPFSNNEYYDEYLVNFDFIESVMKKIGFTLETSESFSSLLNKFKTSNTSMYNNLTQVDKDFISLYSYNVYIKTNPISDSVSNQLVEPL